MKNFAFLFVFCFMFFGTIFPQTWELQTSNVPSGATVAPFSAVDDNTCWASWSTGWNTSSSVNGYLRTTDGGATWTCDTIPETEGGMIWCIDAIDANTAYLAVETWNASGMQGIYKTTDGGATWQKNPTAYSSSAYGPGYIHFFDANNGVAVGEKNTNDSKATTLEIFTTTNAGVNWNLVNKANISPTVTHEFLQPVEVAVYGDNIWLTTQSDNGPRIYKTTNKGYNWSATLPPGVTKDYLAFPAFENESTGLLVAWSFTQPSYSLKKTTDGGATWVDIPQPYGCIPVNVSFVPGTSSTYVITGDVGVNGYAGGSAYTTDGGDTWTTLDAGNYCYLVFNSSNSGWCTGWTTNHFFKYIGPNLLPVELVSFAAELSGKEIILTWITATESNNRGFEIQRKSTNSDFSTIAFVKGNGTTTQQNKYTYSDKNLDNGRYFYRLKQLDFNGQFNYSQTVDIQFKYLDKFSLGQNYPNPFNPSTKIKYSIPNVILSGAKNLVTLKVYDVLGNEIATLVNEYKPAGTYEVEFNAFNLPSGVYFYQLKAGNFMETKKMILIK